MHKELRLQKTTTIDNAMARRPRGYFKTEKFYNVNMSIIFPF